MPQLGTDIRFALRTTRREPGFTAVAVLTLALGLGANVAIFSFVDGVLLKPVEFGEPDRLVMLWEKPPGGGRNGISAANLIDWRKDNNTFEGIAGLSGKSFTMTGSGEPQQLRAQTVSANYFDLMRVTPALGRTFAAGEDEPGKDQVLVLSHRAWQTRFGSDPAIVGRKLVLDGATYEVIGVLREGSSFNRRFAEVIAPLSFRPDQMTRNFHWLSAQGRLKKGVSFEQAKADMDAIGARIAATYPDIKKNWGVTLDRFLDQIVNPQLRQSLYVLMYTVAGVLLIGCVNLANLLLARGSARSRELAIRASIGATRTQLVRQLLTESILLSVAGALLGAALGYGLFLAIQHFTPPFMLPPQADVRMDWRVFGFLAVLAVASGVLFGLAPAWKLSRRDPAEELRDGGRGSSGSLRKGRLRAALVVTEVAMAFVLLAGAGLMIRSFNNMMNVQTGFDETNVLTMDMPLSMEQNTDPALMDSYVRQVVDRAGSLPGVRAAAITSALPMQGWGFGMPFRIAGKGGPTGSERRPCFFKMVTPGYFQTVGLRIRKGRGLAMTDVRGGAPVTVISETMAQRYFPGEDPIGKQILVEEILTGKRELGPEVPWQVVGIVSDERTGGLDSQPSPGMYVAYSQSPVIGFSLAVRTTGEPTAAAKSIQNEVWQINKNQALTNVKTLEKIKSDSTGASRLRTVLLGIFAAVALLLAAIGVYGVLSYSTAQRTQELGVRAALGATPGHLIRLVLNSGMALALIGLAVGLVGALILTRGMESLLFQTKSYDPVTFVVVAAVLAATALLACYVPARRATKIDPVAALRAE